MTFLVGLGLFLLLLMIVGSTFVRAHNIKRAGHRRAHRREQAATLEGAGSHLSERG